jgi:hypothetical protein
MRNCLIVFTVLLFNITFTAFSVNILTENWDSGCINKDIWEMAGLEDGHIELVDLGAGDYAVEISNDKKEYETRIYSKLNIPRADDVRCTFRIWHDGSPGKMGFSGPWHHSPLPLTVTYPAAYTIEAGFISCIDSSDNPALKWFEAGNCTEMEKGADLDKALNKAYHSASSKESSLLIQVELGNDTGSRGYYSTDNGATWHCINLSDGKVIDTRGKASVSKWNGITVSSNRYNHIGFAPYNSKIYIDDIEVVNDSDKLSPPPKPYPDVEAKKLITSDMLKPDGKRYRAEVPDTLDLSQRAKLMVRGLTNFVNPKQRYVTFGQGYFNVNPAYMTQINGSEGHCCWSKNNEALIKARIMSGTEYNLEIASEMIQNMLGMRNVMNPTAHFPWMPRSMITLASIYQIHPDKEMKQLLDGWVAYQGTRLKYKDDYAYFDNSPPHLADSSLGVLGYTRVAFIHGTMIRQMSNWYRITGNKQALEIARLLKNFLIQEKFWQPESAPKAVASADRAHFMGHHHSFTTALMGLLWYAEVTNDHKLMEFVRSGYEYMRNFGLARIGMFAEMCTTGDMTQLALKLSDLGVGDYWEDADSYIRNQLVANQVTDGKLLESVVSKMPENTRELHPVYETADNVVQRNVGCYLSDASNPTVIRKKTMVWTICCNGNCTPALYYAWEATVREKDGLVQVNLLLNRASPWLDINSYLPYEGKVILKNKKSQKIAVRIPLWVDKDSVKAEINNKPADIYWLDRNLIFSKTKKSDEITINFPMVTSKEVYTLKWRERDFWYESTNPGSKWEPDDPPLKYTLTMKGNTLVDIEPRSQSPGYPLYQRDHMRDNNRAPMKEAVRYVPDKWPKKY